MPSPVALRRGETALYSYPLIGSVFFVLSRSLSFARAEPTFSAIIAAKTTATPRTKLMRLINATPFTRERAWGATPRCQRYYCSKNRGLADHPDAVFFETFCTNFSELRNEVRRMRLLKPSTKSGQTQDERVEAYEPELWLLRACLANARAIRAISQPGSRTGVENPKPGNEGATTWKASAASPPWETGSVSGPMMFMNSTTEPGQP